MTVLTTIVMVKSMRAFKWPFTQMQTKMVLEMTHRWSMDVPSPDKVDVGGDCDDIQFYAHPLMIELAMDSDNNCDGQIDEPGAYGEITWYLDADGDGYGVTGTTQVSCLEPQGYSSNDLDCDDSNDLVSPDVQEDCATLYDDNCNGVSNESGAIGETTWYLDADGDTYGTPDVHLIELCRPNRFCVQFRRLQRFIGPGYASWCRSLRWIGQ